MIFEFIDKIAAAGCRFKDVYHMYCPGCGGTRALMALLHLNIVKSLYYNPIVLILIIAESIFWISIVVERKEGQKYKYGNLRLGCRITSLCLWIIFFIFRNYLLIHYNIDMLGDFS